jgi:hypothetical protein
VVPRAQGIRSRVGPTLLTIQQSHTSRRRVLGRVALVLAACVVSALAFEWAVRIANPAYDPRGGLPFYQEGGGPPLGKKDTTYRHSRITGDFDVAVRFNQYGLRDSADLAHSTVDDIFFVGDSATFGHGVEEQQRYSNLVGSMLGLRTFNLGMPGDIDDYQRLVDYAQQHGAKIGKVVVGVNMENDLDNYPAGHEYAAVDTKQPSPLFPLKSYLTNYSAGYAAISASIHGSPSLKAFAVSLGLITELKGFERLPDTDALVTDSASRLERLVKPFQSAILIVPSRLLWTASDDRKMLERKIHDQLAGALTARGFDVIDVRPVFEASGDPMQFHFKFDGHWTAEAHRRAATLLSERLRRWRNEPQ